MDQPSIYSGLLLIMNFCIVRDLHLLLFRLYHLIVTYLYSAWYVLVQLTEPVKKPKDLLDMEGKVCIVTGGGQGIGLETCKGLLKLQMTVIVAGRKHDQIEGVKQLKSLAVGQVLFLECDLASMDSIREFYMEFKKLGLPLHLLINNAGIMFAPFSLTKDGHESHWGVNYISHFYLTHLLMPTLVASGTNICPTRIVNLSSILHYPGTIRFHDPEGTAMYSAEAAYNQSKLAMLMFGNYLSREVEKRELPVIVNSVHPAVAFTGLFKYIWWANYVPVIGRVLLVGPQVGSYTVIQAAASRLITCGGNYLENCSIKAPSKEASDMTKQQKLFDVSCQELNIKSFFEHSVSA